MDSLTLSNYSRGSHLKEAPPRVRSIHGTASRHDSFVEFFVNGRALSRQIDDGNESKSSILAHWTGVLGAYNRPAAELIKVKQLLGKRVTEKDIQNALPAGLEQDELQWHKDQWMDELSDPGIIIYGCAECGDYDCGGVRIAIEKNDTSFVWTFPEMPDNFRFEFDKHQYYSVFQSYLDKLAGRST